MERFAGTKLLKMEKSVIVDSRTRNVTSSVVILDKLVKRIECRLDKDRISRNINSVIIPSLLNLEC